MADDDDLRRLRAGEIDFAQSDLRGADLSGRDLSGCDFTGAHFENAVAHGTNFTGTQLSNVHVINLDATGSNFSGSRAASTGFVHANFQGCNFRDSSFKGCIFNKVNLNGANLSGADFTDAHFNEGTSLEGAYADESTRFDGATVFRPLAREPVFRFYRIERGKLVRLTELPEQTEQQPPEVQPPARTASGVALAPIALVQQRIAQQPREIAVMAVALSEAIDYQIVELAKDKPNEPRALERYESYVSFLQELSSGLKSIHAAIVEALQSSDESGRHERLSRAARITDQLGQEVETWIKDNARLVIDYSSKTTLLAAGTALLSLCGIPAWEAFVPLASYLSGGTFLDGIKELVKSTGGKNKTPSAPEVGGKKQGE